MKTTTERTTMATATKTTPADQLATAEQQHEAGECRLAEARAGLARLLTTATTGGAVTPGQLSNAEGEVTLAERALVGTAATVQQARTAVATEEANGLRERLLLLDSPDHARHLMELYAAAVAALAAFVTAIDTSETDKASAARRLVELSGSTTIGPVYFDGLSREVSPYAPDRRNLALDAAAAAMSVDHPWRGNDYTPPRDIGSLRRRAAVTTQQAGR